MKWHFSEITSEVTLWHETERRMPRVVVRTDILHEFMGRLDAFIPKLELKVEEATDGPEKAQLVVKLQAHKGRRHSLQTGTKVCVERFRDRLLAKIGGRLLVPQRYAKLTPREEEIRCQLTWQQFDERCYITGFAPENEHARCVADPQ